MCALWVEEAERSLAQINSGEARLAPLAEVSAGIRARC